MISQLLATIIMALGIATGNVSSNVYKGGNVFHEVEKQPKPKKSVENISLTYDLGQVVSSYYIYINNINTDYYTAYEKSYLKPQNSTVDNANYIQATDFGLIYNSVYFMNYPEENNGQYYRNFCRTILKIVTYANGYTNYDVDVHVQSSATGTAVQNRRVKYTTNEDADNLLDLTMTASVKDTINSYMTKPYWTTVTDYSNTWNLQNNGSAYLETTGSNIQIDAGQTIYILIENNLMVRNAHSGNFDSYTIGISGQYIQTPINQEIVDIPGLMFTVLTMPFSFISTAFNLTIFPNTPYQLNFTNLFMVLIGAFVILWIIKKVLK